MTAVDVGGHRFLGWILDGLTRLESSIMVQMYGPRDLKSNYGWPSVFSQNVEVATTSALSGYSYDAKNRVVSFLVSGDSGTPGFAKVRVPKELLWPERPTVKVNGQTPLLSNVEDGGSNWVVSFSYVHSDHLVIIPEFRRLAFTLTLGLVATVVLTRRRTRAPRRSTT